MWNKQPYYEEYIVKAIPKPQLNVPARESLNILKKELMKRAKSSEVDYIVLASSVSPIRTRAGNIERFTWGRLFFKEVSEDEVVEVINDPETNINWEKENKGVARSYFFMETKVKK